MFTQSWYTGLEQFAAQETFGDAFWHQVLDIKNAANQAMEQARKDGRLGGSLEAEIHLYASQELLDVLSQLDDELRFVFITSGVVLHPASERSDNAVATEVEGLSIEVTKSAGEKCTRCWHHRADVGTHDAHPELCGRCITNVDGEGETRQYA